MKYSKRWLRIKLTVSLIIILMIFMRLVWMQLRDFPLKSDYRSLVSLSLLHEQMPEQCQMRGSTEQDFGVQEFINKKENYLRTGFQWFYSPGFAWFASLACNGGNFEPHFFIRMNQWFLVATIAIVALIARFLTGSWLIGMISALVLMSRGRIITDSADISITVLLTFLFTVWLLACVHFFRTGSRWSMAFAALITVVGCVFDTSFVFLSLPLPVLLIAGYCLRKLLTQPVLKRLRLEKRRLQAIYARPKDGSMLLFDFMQRLLGTKGPSNYGQNLSGTKKIDIFTTLEIPFILWVSKSRRWLKILLFWTGVAAISFLAISFWQFDLLTKVFGQDYAGVGEWLSANFSPFAANNDLWWQYWLATILEFVDVHFSLSLVLLLICCMGSPIDSFIGFFETCWLLVFSLVILLVGVAFMDFVDFKLLAKFEGEVGMWTVFAWARSALVLKIFEPVILGLAVGGVVNVFSLIRVGMMKAKLKTSRP